MLCRSGLLLVLICAGCGLAAAEDHAAEDGKNAHFRLAQSDLDANNLTGAASEFEAALASNPKLVDAHYQLGLLYADKLQDPISAIYHLQRYLALDPTGDKAATAKSEIEKERQAFAATIPSAETSSNSDQIAKLQADNATLKGQVADAARTISELQTQLATAGVKDNTSVPPPAAPTSVADASTAPATNAASTGPMRALPLGATNAAADGQTSDASGYSGATTVYTLVKGDTVDRIARHLKVPKQTIIDLNHITDPHRLQIGQKLIVPAPSSAPSPHT